MAMTFWACWSCACCWRRARAGFVVWEEFREFMVEFMVEFNWEFKLKFSVEFVVGVSVFEVIVWFIVFAAELGVFRVEFKVEFIVLAFRLAFAEIWAKFEAERLFVKFWLRPAFKPPFKPFKPLLPIPALVKLVLFELLFKLVSLGLTASLEVALLLLLLFWTGMVWTGIVLAVGELLLLLLECVVKFPLELLTSLWFSGVFCSDWWIKVNNWPFCVLESVVDGSCVFVVVSGCVWPAEAVVGEVEVVILGAVGSFQLLVLWNWASLGVFSGVLFQNLFGWVRRILACDRLVMLTFLTVLSLILCILIESYFVYF